MRVLLLVIAIFVCLLITSALDTQQAISVIRCIAVIGIVTALFLVANNHAKKCANHYEQRRKRYHQGEKNTIRDDDGGW